MPIFTPAPPKLPKGATTRSRKNIRAKEVEDKYRPRLHRTVGVFLALKVWTRGFDCIVLSRKELLRFFDMSSTPGDRMEQIKRDVRPWFRGFVTSRPRPNNPTFVNYLFLIRSAENESYFSSGTSLYRRGVKLLVNKVNDNPSAPKTVFFLECVSEGRVPTQEEILSELVLVASGLKAPEVEIQPIAEAKDTVLSR
ncbi:MAG: hypothetical protein DMF70_05195 [Acidobacteria bacterium]|nr:MAG: hypothetical protein DMF70_05195 [Acidobacteriota bacterium]